LLRHFAFTALLCASAACNDGARAQSYSPESLAGLKLFRTIIDLPADAVRCGPNRKDLRDALEGVLGSSKVRLVGLNRTADGVIALSVSVSENCSKAVNMSVLASVTINRTGAVISGLPIWDSGTISFGQGTKFDGPSATQFLGEKFLVAWNSVNH
jgi:hypothetical protein